MIAKKFEFDPATSYWVDAQGNDHKVKDMTERHIKNCIRCLQGKGWAIIPDEHFSYCLPDNMTREEWINLFYFELSSRIPERKFTAKPHTREDRPYV